MYITHKAYNILGSLFRPNKNQSTLQFLNFSPCIDISQKWLTPNELQWPNPFSQIICLLAKLTIPTIFQFLWQENNYLFKVKYCLRFLALSQNCRIVVDGKYVKLITMLYNYVIQLDYIYVFPENHLYAAYLRHCIWCHWLMKVMYSYHGLILVLDLCFEPSCNTQCTV